MKWQEAGEDYLRWSFINFTLYRITLGDKMKDEMGGACSTHEIGVERKNSFGQKTSRE
jgi:hypothetical protein